MDINKLKGFQKKEIARRLGMEQYTLKGLRILMKSEPQRVEKAVSEYMEKDMKKKAIPLKHPPVREIDKGVEKLLYDMENVVHAKNVYDKIADPSPQDHAIYVSIYEKAAPKLKEWLEMYRPQAFVQVPKKKLSLMERMDAMLKIPEPQAPKAEKAKAKAEDKEAKAKAKAEAKEAKAKAKAEAKEAKAKAKAEAKEAKAKAKAKPLAVLPPKPIPETPPPPPPLKKKVEIGSLSEVAKRYYKHYKGNYPKVETPEEVAQALQIALGNDDYKQTTVESHFKLYRKIMSVLKKAVEKKEAAKPKPDLSRAKKLLLEKAKATLLETESKRVLRTLEERTVEKDALKAYNTACVLKQKTPTFTPEDIISTLSKAKVLELFKLPAMTKPRLEAYLYGALVRNERWVGLLKRL